MSLSGRIRAELRDPSTRPRTANLLVAGVAVLLAVAMLALAAVVAWGPTPVIPEPWFGVGAPVQTAGALIALAALSVGFAYGHHWHRRYVFEGHFGGFTLGTVGAVLTLLGVGVAAVVPVAGLGLIAVGILANVLGEAWGTFVYTYRKYRRHGDAPGQRG